MFDFIGAGLLCYVFGIIIFAEDGCFSTFLQENVKTLLTVAAYFLCSCKSRIPGIEFVLHGLLCLYIFIMITLPQVVQYTLYTGHLFSVYCTATHHSECTLRLCAQKMRWRQRRHSNAELDIEPLEFPQKKLVHLVYRPVLSGLICMCTVQHAIVQSGS